VVFIRAVAVIGSAGDLSNRGSKVVEQVTAYDIAAHGRLAVFGCNNLQLAVRHLTGGGSWSQLQTLSRRFTQNRSNGPSSTELVARTSPTYGRAIVMFLWGLTQWVFVMPMSRRLKRRGKRAALKGLHITSIIGTLPGNLVRELTATQVCRKLTMIQRSANCTPPGNSSRLPL